MNEIMTKFFILNALLCVMGSCHTQKISEGYGNDKKETENYGVFVKYALIDRYEIIDSLAIDSMISVAMRKHEKTTVCVPSFFAISQLPKINGYNIESCSTYDGQFQGEEISRHYGFSYYESRVILIDKANNPIKLFRSTGEMTYVMLYCGGTDKTTCMFDSTFHFVKSWKGKSR